MYGTQARYPCHLSSVLSGCQGQQPELNGPVIIDYVMHVQAQLRILTKCPRVTAV